MGNGLVLRQIAFATTDLAASNTALVATGHWRAVGQDRHSEVFGLTSHIFQQGAAFAEMLVPTTPTSAVGRFLAKHPGEVIVPYMIVLHDTAPDTAPDTPPVTWRVHETQRPTYRSTHLHPKAVPPLMIAVARPDHPQRWPLTDRLLDEPLPEQGCRYTELVIDVEDAPEVARRWSTLLDAPAITDRDELRVTGAELTVRIRPGKTDRIVRVCLTGGCATTGQSTITTQLAGIDFSTA